MLNEQLINKWQPVLDHEDLPEIKDSYRKLVTAQLLEMFKPTCSLTRQILHLLRIMLRHIVLTLVTQCSGLPMVPEQMKHPLLLQQV
jgi:hypothetical protein